MLWPVSLIDVYYKQSFTDLLLTSIQVDLRGKLIQLDRDIDEYCKDHEQEEFEAWKREQDRCLQQYKLDKKYVCSDSK